MRLPEIGSNLEFFSKSDKILFSSTDIDLIDIHLCAYNENGRELSSEQYILSS